MGGVSGCAGLHLCSLNSQLDETVHIRKWIVNIFTLSNANAWRITGFERFHALRHCLRSLIPITPVAACVKGHSSLSYIIYTHLSKQGMLSRELIRSVQGNEELAGVIVPSSIGHAHKPAAVELESGMELILAFGKNWNAQPELYREGGREARLTLNVEPYADSPPAEETQKHSLKWKWWQRKGALTQRTKLL